MVKFFTAFLLFGASSFICQAGQVEVLHWWTSGSEAKAAQLLKAQVEQQGHHWQDFAIAGGGGQSAMTILRSRAVAGTPPSAAQIKGPSIAEWGKLGFLTDLTPLAEANQWERLMPPQVLDLMRYQGKFVAIPANIHRVNSLWLNAKLLRQVNGKAPTTLEELFQLADTFKVHGITPIAHHNQPWQNVTLFDAIALATLGADNYRKAFVQLDPKTLTGPQMELAFSQFRRLKQYMGDKITNNEWYQATQNLIQGQAAMQFSGDWVKGELHTAQLKPGKDYLCVATPGSQNAFSYNVDSFAFFKLRGQAQADAIQAQQTLAEILMNKGFQQDFNQLKGSIPVRTDLNTEAFDECAQASMEQFQQGQQQGTAVPSVSQGIATSSYVARAIEGFIHQFFNDDEMTTQQAVARLAKVIQAAS